MAISILIYFRYIFYSCDGKSWIFCTHYFSLRCHMILPYYIINKKKTHKKKSTLVLEAFFFAFVNCIINKKRKLIDRIQKDLKLNLLLINYLKCILKTVVLPHISLKIYICQCLFFFYPVVCLCVFLLALLFGIWIYFSHRLNTLWLSLLQPWSKLILVRLKQ